MPATKHYRLLILLVPVLATSCKHGIEIIGEDRVNSATGDLHYTTAGSTSTLFGT